MLFPINRMVSVPMACFPGRFVGVSFIASTSHKSMTFSCPFRGNPEKPWRVNYWNMDASIKGRTVLGQTERYQALYHNWKPESSKISHELFWNNESWNEKLLSNCPYFEGSVGGINVRALPFCSCPDINWNWCSVPGKAGGFLPISPWQGRAMECLIKENWTF